MFKYQVYNVLKNNNLMLICKVVTFEHLLSKLNIQLIIKIITATH